MEQELARLNHAPSAPGTAAAAVRPGGWPSVRARETLNGVLPCASFPCRAHNFSLCRSPARPAGKARRAYRETQPPARRQGEDHTDHSEGRATVEGFPSSAGKRKRRRVAEVPDRTAGNRWETLQQTQCRTVPIGGKRLALCNGRRERRLTSLSITCPEPLPTEKGARGGASQQTLVLLFLAFDTMPRPGNRFQAFYLNLSLTGHAQAVSAVLEAF